MPEVGAMRFGGRTVAVAIVVLVAMAGQLVQGQVPSSRNTGYSTSVDLRLPVGSAGRAKAVLESARFQVWLEGDDRDKCSLSVREKYTGRGPPESRPLDRGYLLWSANYYSHTPAGADKCTLTFTAGGDLQLRILYRGATSLTWSSKTAGKGVTRMALQTVPDDNGNFQLLTASRKAVFQSFNFMEWLVLRGQKFWAGQLLKSPDQVYNESDSRVLANSAKYIMAIKGGDLQLLMNGPNPQVYWSLKAETPGFKVDLSRVRYAAVVGDDEQGIGLYTAGGSLVFRIAVPPWVPQYGADWHFGLDSFGNLKYYLMYKGASWSFGWAAISDPCNLPSFCGQYGVCTSFIDQFSNPANSCACPRGFKAAGALDSSGCVRESSVNKCNHSKYLVLSGYDSAYLRYVTPTTKQTVSDCKASCSVDCKCDGVFYNVRTKGCYKVTQILTLKKATTGTSTSVYIKVK